MPHTFHPKYLKSIEELQTLLDAALELLDSAEQQRLSYLEKQGYQQFEKLALELSTLFKLIPGTKSFGDDEATRCMDG
jgi:hypothetical protein